MYVSELTESDISEEHDKKFNEDQELEQLINGEICFKVYPFSSGMVKPLGLFNTNRQTLKTQLSSKWYSIFLLFWM